MSERIESEILRTSNTPERFEYKPHPPTELGVLPEKRVRERSAELAAHRDYRDSANPVAHPSVGLIAQLNATWRVVNDPLQWRLQRKKGNPRTKNSGWRNRSFCTTRVELLRCVREYCGEVGPAALAKLIALPEHHGTQNLDVRGTSHAQVEEQSKGLASLGSGGLQD